MVMLRMRYACSQCVSRSRGLGEGAINCWETWVMLKKKIERLDAGMLTEVDCDVEDVYH